MFYSTTQFPGLGNVFGTLAEENTSDKDIRKVGWRWRTKTLSESHNRSFPFYRPRLRDYF